MDTTQINPNQNYFTSGATFDTSKPIPVSGLTTSPTPVSTPPVPTLSTPENLANFSVADLTATPSPTATETKKSGVMSSIGDLYSKYFNKGAEQQAMETQAGLPEKNKALTDAINAFRTTTMEQNQLLQEQGAIPLALQEQVQGRGITAGGLAPIQAGELRKNAIKQYQVTSKGLFQQAIVANLRDDIAGATANIEKAISYKYAPIEQEIKYLTDVVLPDLRDTLNKEDKKREQDLQIKINEKNRLLENAKEDSKAGANLALTAMNNFPNDKQAQLNAQLAMQEAQKEQPDLNKIFQLVGQYQKDPIATAQALANLNKTRAEVAKLNEEARANNITTAITNPNATKYSGALSVVLGSSKLTKDQKNDLIMSVNSGEDPATVLKNKAKDILGTDAKELTGYEVAKQELQNISSIMDEYYANNGSTGIFSGNTEKVLNKLGEVRDPKLVEIATRLGVAIMNYRRAVTGTAASVQEDANITSVFPGINKSEGLNKAIIGARIQSFDSTIDSLYENALGKNAYNSIKQAEIANTQLTQTEQPKLSVDDAYAEYLKTVSGTQTQQTQTPITPLAPVEPVKTTTSMLPDFSGYKGFTLDSFFK